jgi:hypothetical protein
MKRKGKAPRPEEPEEASPAPSTEPGADADTPLPSWYRPPEPPSGDGEAVAEPGVPGGVEPAAAAERARADAVEPPPAAHEPLPADAEPVTAASAPPPADAEPPAAASEPPPPGAESAPAPRARTRAAAWEPVLGSAEPPASESGASVTTPGTAASPSTPEPGAPRSPTPFAWEPPPAPPLPASWAAVPGPPGPAFERGPDATDEPLAADAAETPGDTAPLTGDAAPLSAAAAVHVADEDLPTWSRVRDEDAAAAEADPPTAVADAWTTHPEPGTPPPPWAVAQPREHAHVFGDRMAAGVPLALAAASMVGGGIYGLVISDINPTIRAVICGVAAAVLLAGAVVLRLVRGTDELRSTLAVVGIGFAAACIVFAYNPDQPADRDNLVKFALGAGIVAVLSWFAAVVVPSAVAGLLGVIALATAAGAGVWLGVDQPTHVQVFVAAIGIGLAAALLLPRIALLRPHPAGLGWALSGAALVIAVPAIELMARQDALALAAGATASAALLALAQRYRNLPAALGAFAGLAYLELLVVTTRTGDNNQVQGTQLVIFVAVGAVLALLVAGAVVMQRRRKRPVPVATRARRSPVAVADFLLVAALALSVLTLFTGPRDVQLSPTQLQPGTTTTSAAPPAAPL